MSRWRRPTSRGNLSEAVMTHWHERMVDRPETDGAVYVTGWTYFRLSRARDGCCGLGLGNLDPPRQWPSDRAKIRPALR